MEPARAQTQSGSGPTDAALVVAARAGDRWAQEALFHRYARMVNVLAFQLLGQDSEVDDLVQEAFLGAFGSLHRLDEPQAFAAWLRAVTVRTALKLLRRRRLLRRIGWLRSQPLDADDLISPNAPPEAALELHRLYGVLVALPPPVRVALVLRRVQGMTIEEVADAMNLSPATVKRRLADAEKVLRSLEGEEGRTP